MTSAGPEPGWYFDPDGGESERYWNGAEWTEHRRSKPPNTGGFDAEPVAQTTRAAKGHEATRPPGLGRRSDQNDELDSSPTQNAPGRARGADSLSHPTTRASITDRWHRLSNRRRIALVGVPILALVVALIMAATGVFAPRGPLDRRWVHRPDSYKAGFEAGQSYVDDVDEHGGSAGSKDEILRTCNLFASNGTSLSAGVHWSGGVIPHNNFEAEPYRNGCLDGAEDARD
ncbi:DUF2510 domain-containing protein [Mycolicibacterium fortuitum]|uniref:DUF2510 domain-containing protein n=1 Tax=Mycolicibacterium fortuitum TaxID=1766 RepID=UPI0009459EE1|nr:DUF2510 domain-containing protein [Mycolicibacterium fortuitum]